MPTCTCIYYSWSIQMSTWKVSVYGDCLPLSHLSHHRRLDSPAPKYNQSWCPDEHVGSIVYGDYPPPDALLALSQHRWQPVPARAPPPPPPKEQNHNLSDYLPQSCRSRVVKCKPMARCIARLAQDSPKRRGTIMLWWKIIQPIAPNLICASATDGASINSRLIKKAYPCWL